MSLVSSGSSSKIQTAVRWTLLASGSRIVFAVLQTAILTRVMSPAVFGGVAIVVAGVAFLTFLSEVGISTAIVQTPKISQEERCALFFATILSGMICGLLAVPTGFVASNVYEIDELSGAFIVSGAAMIPLAILSHFRSFAEKILSFRRLALIEIGATGVGVLVCVIAAANGYGVMSLSVGFLVSNSLGALLAWLYLREGWTPKMWVNPLMASSILRRGFLLFINNVVNQINGVLDIAVGGYVMSAHGLGIYSAPRNLVLQVMYAVNPVVSRIAFSAIAARQGDKEYAAKIFISTLSASGGVSIPIYIFFAVFSPEVVFIYFGDQWGASAEVLSILSVWGIFRATGNSAGSLILGAGLNRRLLAWNIATTTLFLVAAIIGSTFGAIGLAYGLSLTLLLLFYPGWRFLINPACGVAFGKYTVTIVRPIAVGTISAVVTLFALDSIDLDLWHRLLLALVLMFPIYLAGICWIDSLFYSMVKAVFRYR